MFWRRKGERVDNIIEALFWDTVFEALQDENKINKHEKLLLNKYTLKKQKDGVVHSEEKWPLEGKKIRFKETELTRRLQVKRFATELDILCSIPVTQRPEGGSWLL